MYTREEIKNESYKTFLNKLKTQLITNNNVKETIGNLLDAPDTHHIVTEIEKQYNLDSGINYELKKKFGNNQTLPQSKMIRDIKYFKSDERCIIFLITKNKKRQLSTYENIYISLINLKQFCEKNKIDKLVMNKLGQSDNLDGDKIRSMLRYIFKNTNIKILICTNDEYTEEEKQTILQQYHDSKLGGHLGINKTIKKNKKAV
jgi:hypothetical protein